MATELTVRVMFCFLTIKYWKIGAMFHPSWFHHTCLAWRKCSKNYCGTNNYFVGSLDLGTSTGLGERRASVKKALPRK